MKLKLLIHSFIFMFFFVQIAEAGIMGPHSGIIEQPKETPKPKRYEQKYGIKTDTDKQETNDADKTETTNTSNKANHEPFEGIVQDQTGIKCDFDENSMLFCLDKKDKPLTGRRVARFSDETFMSIENFKQGYLDGLCTYFNPKGEKIERSYYKKGIKNGESKLYYSTNNIKVVTNYNDGKLNGTLDVYLPDGKLLGRMSYKEGYLQKGYCTNGGKKQNFKKGMLKTHPYNTIYSCGLPL